MENEAGEGRKSDFCGGKRKVGVPVFKIEQLGARDGVESETKYPRNPGGRKSLEEQGMGRDMDPLPKANPRPSQKSGLEG